jgi:hypothetical protein
MIGLSAERSVTASLYGVAGGVVADVALELSGMLRIKL